MSQLLRDEAFKETLYHLHLVWGKMGYDEEEKQRMETLFKESIQAQMSTYLDSYIQVCTVVFVLKIVARERAQK
jgi:hypothetical protein